MSSSKERFNEVMAALDDAEQSWRSDYARARSEEQINQIESNLWKIRGVFFSTTAEFLGANNDAAEGAYSEIKAANDSIKKAREKSESITKLITKLQKATLSAEKLVKFASTKQ